MHPADQPCVPCRRFYDDHRSDLQFRTISADRGKCIGTGRSFSRYDHIYDLKLQQLIRDTAKEEQIEIREGVYLQTTGPNFESPAEIRMYGLVGADAVGMSTACEAIAARHAGVRVCGISCISNMASGLSEEELSHLDVQTIANKRAEEFERLVTKVIGKF